MGSIRHSYGLHFYRDASLALEIHAVKHLVAHQALWDRTSALEQAVSQGRLAVVDMSNDRKITKVVLVHGVGGSSADGMRTAVGAPGICISFLSALQAMRNSSFRVIYSAAAAAARPAMPATRP